MPGISAARLIKNADGVYIGVIGVDMDLEVLFSMVDQSARDAGGIAAILDAKKRVIAHSDINASNVNATRVTLPG